MKFCCVPMAPFAESHIRVAPEARHGQLAILDYRAPAGFGPPRHLHQRDDEVIELVEGQVVVWTSERSLVLAPGDLVLLAEARPAYMARLPAASPCARSH